MKEKLIEYVKNHLNQRIQNSLSAMQAAQESANGDSKSSAGDKYETTRAMGHLDREVSYLSPADDFDSPLADSWAAFMASKEVCIRWSK